MVSKTEVRSTGLRTWVGLGLSAVFGLTTMTAAPCAHAADAVAPTGKGVVGGALLGAEVITITEAIAGVKPGWAYLVGGGVGAVGGGVAGYAIEQSVSDGKVPVFMLAGGLALVIPAVVLSLNATRYQPVVSGNEDRAPTNGPEPEPGVTGGNAATGGGAAPANSPTPPPPAAQPAPGGAPAPPHQPESLLDLGGGSMRMGVPVPQVRAMYTPVQLKELGVPQQTEYRFPVVKLTF